MTPIGLIQLLADLGLERSSKAERGLVVWALVFSFFALLTLLLWRRGFARYGKAGSPNDPSRGAPFMKKTAVAVAQIACGIIAVYAAARLIEPKATRPQGWFLISPPHEVTVLAQQGDTIWAGGREGVFAVNRKTRQILAIAEIQSRDLRAARALLCDDRQVYIGCRQGLMRYDGTRLQALFPPGRDDIGPVTAILHEHDGTFWIGVEKGVWRVDPAFADWKWFGRDEGLTLPSVDVIYQTHDGNLWFGSNAPEAPGVFLFDRKIFTNVGSGLPHHAVNDLLEDHAGTLWIATGFGSRGAAARLENGKWTELSNLPGINGEKIRSLFEDSRQRLWFCSEYNGVAMQTGQNWKRLTVDQGLPGSEVKDMLQDGDGWLWLATERGLGCLQTMP